MEPLPLVEPLTLVEPLALDELPDELLDEQMHEPLQLESSADASTMTLRVE